MFDRMPSCDCVSEYASGGKGVGEKRGGILYILFDMLSCVIEGTSLLKTCFVQRVDEIKNKNVKLKILFKNAQFILHQISKLRP